MEGMKEHSKKKNGGIPTVTGVSKPRPHRQDSDWEENPGCSFSEATVFTTEPVCCQRDSKIQQKVFSKLMG